MWLLSTLMTGVLLVGLAVVIYSLAVGTVELVNKVRLERKYREQLAVYKTLVIDDVYYRDSYAELFSSLVRDLDGKNPNLLGDASGPCKELTFLVNAVKQFVDDSKVVR